MVDIKALVGFVDSEPEVSGLDEVVSTITPLSRDSTSPYKYSLWALSLINRAEAYIDAYSKDTVDAATRVINSRLTNEGMNEMSVTYDMWKDKRGDRLFEGWIPGLLSHETLYCVLYNTIIGGQLFSHIGNYKQLNPFTEELKREAQSLLADLDGISETICREMRSTHGSDLKVKTENKKQMDSAYFAKEFEHRKEILPLLRRYEDISVKAFKVLDAIYQKEAHPSYDRNDGFVKLGADGYF